MMSLNVIAPQLCAMEPELIQGVLGQEHIRNAVCNKLSENDLNRFSQANRQIRGYIEPVLDACMMERAIIYSKALSAVRLDFGFQRKNFADNEAFRNYVQQKIRDFAAQNPGVWITLNLGYNGLGSNSEFFEQLMHDIMTMAHEFNIDIAAFYLDGNQLTTLPEHIFAGLTQLQELLSL